MKTFENITKKTREILKKIKMEEILLIFILLQPLFDLYMGVVGDKLDILGVSIVTIIRIITIITLFVFVVVKSLRNNTNIKLTKLMIIYIALVGLYALFHHLNISLNGFYFINKGLYNSNLEFLYVLRLILPIMFIYTIVLIKPNKNTIIKALIASAAIISIIIVVTNIFKVSFSSYFSEKVFIEGNIFEWIDLNPDQVNYKMYTSKGLFVSANQMAALLSMLGFVVIYNTCKRQNILMYITLFVQTIAMIMIGTRTSSYGWKLAFILMFLIYLYKYIRYKKIDLTKRTIIVMITILAFGIFFSEVSPSNYRTFAKNYEEEYENSLKAKEENPDYISPSQVEYYMQNDSALIDQLQVVGEGYDVNLLRKDFVEDYIKNNYEMHFIPLIYIEKIYPYQDDPIFWLEMFKKPLYIKGDNRARQILIVQRIKENNHNQFLDTLFGIGATPLNQREFMVEKDIVAHIYNLGIIGLILFVLPYLGILIYIFKDKLHIKIKQQSTETSIYILSILLAYSIAYMAGHVIDEYIVSIYIATITALLVINVYEEGK